MTSPPSRTETTIGLAVLALLVLTAAVILKVKETPNPAVLVAGQAVGQGPVAAADLLAPQPGVTPLSSPEAFGPSTLSDKINGKADLYLNAGFVGLVTQRFALEGPGDPWVEVFAYDMGKAQNAYAVFSSQRRQDARSLAIGDGAYATANAVFIISGPAYFEIVASAQGDGVVATMEAMAMAMAGPAKPKAGPAEADLFPALGLVADSIGLQAANAFGFDRLDKVFTARYTHDGREVTLFFSRRDSAREAVDLAAAYAGFLKDYGGTSQPTAMESARMIAIMDAHELIFTVGEFVAGVHEAPDQATAEALGDRLALALKEAGQ